MRGRRIVLVAVSIAAMVGVGHPAGRASAPVDPNAWRAEVVDVPSGDGTPLRTTVFLPQRMPANGRVPVILEVTPYGGSGGDAFDPAPTRPHDPDPGWMARYERAFARGYAFVVVHLRGTGGSGGCYDYGGPGEMADAKAAVEWAASRPWSTGKVGMVGHSYPGWTQLMAAAQAPKGLAAVIPSGPVSGYTNSFTNGVSLVTGRGFPPFYVANDLVPPSVAAPPGELEHALAGSVSRPDCYVSPTAGSLSNDPDGAYWRARDLPRMLRSSTVPMLWVHGFDDFNVRPVSGQVAFEATKGFKRAVLGPWDHTLRGDPARGAAMRMTWFDAFLKDDPRALAEVRAWPVARVQEPDGSWHAASAWPPVDVERRTMRVAPGSYLDAPGNNGETELPPYAQRFVGADVPPVLPTGIGTWTFGEPLRRELHVRGVPRLTVRASTLLAGATLTANLYDVDATGRATHVLRGASLLRGPGEHEVTFDLSPHDWRFRPGHRVGLLLGGGDTLWLEPGKSATPVRVTGGTLDVPVAADATAPPAAAGPYVVGPRTAPFTVPAPTMAAATVPAPA